VLLVIALHARTILLRICWIYFFVLPAPARSTLCPYATLFRSLSIIQASTALWAVVRTALTVRRCVHFMYLVPPSSRATARSRGDTPKSYCCGSVEDTERRMFSASELLGRTFPASSTSSSSSSEKPRMVRAAPRGPSSAGLYP